MNDENYNMKSRRSRGRPRLNEQPCSVRIGVPLTVADNEALLALVEVSLTHGVRVSKQEIIRQLIRDKSSERDAVIQD